MKIQTRTKGGQGGKVAKEEHGGRLRAVGEGLLGENREHEASVCHSPGRTDAMNGRELLGRAGRTGGDGRRTWRRLGSSVHDTPAGEPPPDESDATTRLRRPFSVLISPPFLKQGAQAGVSRAGKKYIYRVLLGQLPP